MGFRGLSRVWHEVHMFGSKYIHYGSSQCFVICGNMGLSQFISTGFSLQVSC